MEESESNQIHAPQPETPTSTKSANILPTRTSSPMGDTVLGDKTRVDLMDALPQAPRTPRKSGNPCNQLGPGIDSQLRPLAKFFEVKEEEWVDLFSQKIFQCGFIFDFGEPQKDMFEKEVKTAALTDLLMFIVERGDQLGHRQYREIIDTFGRNVFRSPPPPAILSCPEAAFDFDEEDLTIEPNWPHMHLVYEMLIRLVELPSFNVNLAKDLIDARFIQRLLALFDMDDNREREMVKTAVHRVYGKFLSLRAYIRKTMRHIFQEFVYEEERHHISEMLEILSSVVNGFAVPLREEHKIFLERTLIPLHKNPRLPLYYTQLALCVVQFAEKDSILVPRIIHGLLRLWPRTNTTKELMFINEIEEVLDVTPAEVFPSMMVALMQRLALCIASPHFQVAERSLHLWTNEYIVSLLADHSQTVMPIVLPVMLQFSRSHWNKTVQLQVFNSLRVLLELNPSLYQQISSQCLSPSVPVAPIEPQYWEAVEARARTNSLLLYSSSEYHPKQSGEPRENHNKSPIEPDGAQKSSDRLAS